MPMVFDRKISTYGSSLQALNGMFENGKVYKSDQIFMFYAPPATGKSLMLAQEACFFASQGKNVLYIDTEGSATTYLQKWGAVFENRFGTLKGNIVVHPVSNLLDLVRFLGRTAEVAFVQSTANKKKKAKEKAKDQGAEVEEDKVVEVAGGKQEFRSMQVLVDPEIEQKIKKYEIDVIVIDSITAPLASMFSTGTQNFPARSDAVSCIFGLLTDIQVKHNIVILTTSHASTNPTNPYEIREEMKGGRTVKYFAKNLVFIDKRDKTEAANFRRFWLARSEDAQGWTKVGIALINDTGYVDIKTEEKESAKEIAFTDGERGRITDYV